jgi:hypothetical protein
MKNRDLRNVLADDPFDAHRGGGRPVRDGSDEHLPLRLL